MTELPGHFIDGNGPPVVLLHCSLGSKNQWRGLSSLLCGGYKTIAVDLYGYGDTPMPSRQEGFTLLDEAQLVNSVLDRAVPGQSFHLVGHSYGAAVALALCHQDPGRVRSLTLFEPVAFHLLDEGDPGLVPVLSMMQELEGLLAAGQRGEAVRTFVDYWSGSGAFARYPARLRHDFAARTEKLALDFRALTQTPLSLEDYRQMRVKGTLIAGRSSRIPALRVAEKLSQALPQLRMVWLDTGHMGPVTDPDQVNPVIIRSIL